ncbi:hypothetical protein A2165_02795 [Candidatus Curtissbacteria bacterium RBG_13_40_7]|uniref:Uncharacterized protein n=1 Tax=Candidatus Curtissbacteria bacterium RBG_13_40_7 TaxID=1797706 RepID=A0A1F5FWJ2_9BACT|nr:MAG: hypothetical protein A2165_02795 [Candidatus Curtissbacteria bacterium RBG_13_40_7]
MFKLKVGSIHAILLVLVVLVVLASITVFASDAIEEKRPLEFVSSLITKPCTQINCKGYRIVWETPQVSLKTNGFYIKVNGKTFTGNSQSTIRSDPGNPTYTTLEVEWKEKNVPMRLYMYFSADGTNWKVTEVRTYNGKNPGDWVIYNGFEGRRLGQSLTGTLRLVSQSQQPNKWYSKFNRRPAPEGEIVFKDINLLPFRNLVQ